LENQLASWRPRRPSPGLKRKLFGAPMRLAPKLAWAVGSLVPAAACLLLTFSAFNPGNPGISSHNGPMIAAILSNQNSAAYAPGNLNERQNSLFSVTFDWTNHGDLISSMGSFPQGKTND